MPSYFVIIGYDLNHSLMRSIMRPTNGMFILQTRKKNSNLIVLVKHRSARKQIFLSFNSACCNDPFFYIILTTISYISLLDNYHHHIIILSKCRNPHSMWAPKWRHCVKSCNDVFLAMRPNHICIIAYFSKEHLLSKKKKELDYFILLSDLIYIFIYGISFLYN